MLIVPTTIAWKNASRPSIRPRLAATAAAIVAIPGSGSPLSATQPAAKANPISCVKNIHRTGPITREFVPPRKSLAPPRSDEASAGAEPVTGRSLLAEFVPPARARLAASADQALAA